MEKPVGDTMMVTVEVYTEDAVVRHSSRYQIVVPFEKITDADHCRSIFDAGVELTCALVDGVYQKEEKRELKL